MLIVCFSVSMLEAQASSGGGNSSSDIFPLALVLQGAEYSAGGTGAGTVWQPDWPDGLPPDTFKSLSAAAVRASAGWDGFTLSLSFDSMGRVLELPFVIDGGMAQLGFVYGGISDIAKLTISFASGDDPWELEILEYRDSSPYLVRAFRAGAWYFIYYSRTTLDILETWYDEEGGFVGSYGYQLINIGGDKRIRAVRNYLENDGGTEYHFDSRVMITESSSPAGVYKVLYYKDDLPRYWERRPSDGGGLVNYYFQWDETGLLRRVTGEGEDGPFDYRYDYTLDGRGNWVERSEVRMVYQSGQPGGQAGLWVPTPGSTFRRVLEYGE